MTLFTVDLASGESRDIYSSTDWLSHPQFSPVNPSLIMYSLEGPWHLVDRVWLIKADGSKRNLIHKRTMHMEIAGHEFWSQDGRHILYDWQFPKGQTFFLASYNVDSGQRKAINLRSDQWSIHFNSTSNPVMFVGDGANKFQVARSADATYIYLYRVVENKVPLSQPNLLDSNTANTEKLVDMRGHDYELEPNVRISPDNGWVFFNSNMFGAPAVFAVEVKRTDVSNLPKRSTFEMASARKARYKSILMLN